MRRDLGARGLEVHVVSGQCFQTVCRQHVQPASLRCTGRVSSASASTRGGS
jgi:hypothetical protein